MAVLTGDTINELQQRCKWSKLIAWPRNNRSEDQNGQREGSGPDKLLSVNDVHEIRAYVSCPFMFMLLQVKHDQGDNLLYHNKSGCTGSIHTASGIRTQVCSHCKR